MVKGLLIGAIIVGGYAGLFGLLYYWIHSRLFKRAQAAATTLEQAGARILAVRKASGYMKPAEVELELDGKQARFQVRTWSRDYIVQSIRLASAPLPGILVRAERSLDRLGKSLGLNREVQLGDKAFDDAAYLESSAADAVVRRAFAGTNVRARVMDLLRLGYWLELSRDGIGASRVRGFYSSFEPGDLAAVVQLLDAIVAELPRFPESEIGKVHARFGAAGVGFALLIAGVASFVLVPAVHPPMDDLDSIKIFGLGLVAWLVVMGVLSRAFRGRADGLRQLLVLGLFLIFAVPPLFATGVFAANSFLDRAATETHRVQIAKLSRRDHEVWFPSWRPGRERDKVGTTFDVFRTLQVGDSIEIDTRAGALGWTWVPAVRKVSGVQ